MLRREKTFFFSAPTKEVQRLIEKIPAEQRNKKTQTKTKQQPEIPLMHGMVKVFLLVLFS